MVIILLSIWYNTFLCLAVGMTDFQEINIDILPLTSDCAPRIDLSQMLRTLPVFDWISSRASDCLGWKIILWERFFQIVKRFKTMSRTKQIADSKQVQSLVRTIQKPIFQRLCFLSIWSFWPFCYSFETIKQL